ncbi:putative pentatricopeptide repeat-containing protein At3g15130 [Mangifera indica]|uniref:putative pentatricopeptide repeat-containing protein At3g15130 n=1 Tax=Mangifera indica TaxID=29780 RepID=UPI001CF9851B|nr:putative pentatricopeptide repeat-containing protein At3g15130 [Mangifera indica]
MNQVPVFVLSERQRFAEILRYCSKNLLVDLGFQVHGAVVRMGLSFDLMLNNDLIDMYAKCGKMDQASLVFDKMLERNVVSWTALMCGFLQNGNAKKSLFIFSGMGSSGVKPNEFTFSTAIKASGVENNSESGRQIQGMCVKTGFERKFVVGNSIIDMYAKCARIDEAVLMFITMPIKNLITWNVMIAGYTLAGYSEKGLLLFRKMQEQGEVPDEFTFTSTLKACNCLGSVQGGTQIHGFLITSGFPYSAKTAIAGALVDFYVKCGYLLEARRVFDQIEQKSVISRSSLILGYAQDGNLAVAMDLFRQLMDSNFQVDAFVLSSMMGVFADLALVEQGKQIHAYAIKVPSGLDVSVSNSIVDMYLKCGLIDEAAKLFSEIPARNVVSWTVMITGYGKHGLGREAVSLFNKMLSENIEPDDVTYLAVLTACSHSGLSEESEVYFSRLCHDPRIKPRVEHYSCMVDSLGRAGRLKDARSLIESMPLQPSIAIWQTLLSACRIHGDLELGREVGEILLKMDSDNAVNYVMMSNIHADAGYWNECERIRKLVKSKGLKKVAGRSWVEIDKEVHFFYGGDDTHPQTEKINQVLKEMERRMKEELGYVYGVKFALRDVEEESKEESLRVHSEKLAIGLALACGGMDEQAGKVIRVFKNLRVCGDCHEFIKGLSKILKVAFLVRDANRFHKFEGGQCSCGDYW